MYPVQRLSPDGGTDMSSIQRPGDIEMSVDRPDELPELHFALSGSLK